jgi:hypothetical protein
MGEFYGQPGNDQIIIRCQDVAILLIVNKPPRDRLSYDKCERTIVGVPQKSNFNPAANKGFREKLKIGMGMVGGNPTILAKM